MAATIRDGAAYALLGGTVVPMARGVSEAFGALTDAAELLRTVRVRVADDPVAWAWLDRAARRLNDRRAEYLSGLVELGASSRPAWRDQVARDALAYRLREGRL